MEAKAMDFRTVRVHNAVTAGAEKRLLIWMAERLPEWVNSDHLTSLGAAALLGVGACFWLGGNALALVIPLLVLNWFGDSLDGTLARVRQRQRPRYGFYVDHVIDEFGIALLIGGMSLSGYMSPWVAALLLIAYFMLTVEVFLATHVLGTFRMSFFKVGPTELRILLAIGNTVALWKPTAHVFGQEFPFFDVGGLIGAIGLALTLVLSAISNTRKLYRLEPMPTGSR